METIEYKNTIIDKSKWGNGAWLNEPDKKQWLDEETGLPCLLVRNCEVTGAWCGYVGLKEGHPLYEKEYSKLAQDIDVHGGLTFSGICQKLDDESTGICHKTDNEDKVWWLGFDCAHGGDLCPKIVAAYTSFGEIYRDIEYVKAEVEKLARQLSTIPA